MEKKEKKIKKQNDICKASCDLLKKEHEPVTVVDMQRAFHQDYAENIIKEIKKFSKENTHRDFYIVVLVKQERLFINAIRHIIMCRFSCPTPEFDQTVYFYDYKKEDAKFLWTTPSKITCKYMMSNPLKARMESPDLFEHVYNFMHGELFKKMKLLNKEKMDAPYLLES